MPNDSYPELLSLAAHEFRTPASVVSGYLRMLQRDTGAPMSERQRHMIDEAEKACGRLVALVAELSDIGKLDAGTAAFGHQAFDLLALVTDVAGGVHEAADRGVRLEARGATSGAEMTGDVTRMRAAIDAIFRAILREKPAACTVVADCRIERSGPSASSAVIVVAEDGGVQAAYETTPGVFDDTRGGLGLALPIARRVIEKHGGRIWSPADDPRRAAVLVFPVSE